MAEDLILVISIVAALGIGLVGGLLYSSVFGSANKRTRTLEEEVDTLKREQTEYKQQVNQHFKKTADLFQGLNEQYKAIYTHMAEGSEKLCTERTSPPALDLPAKPRLTEKAEQPVIQDKPAEKPAAEEKAGSEEPVTKTETQKEKDTPAESKKATSSEDDHMLGDAPNIPEMPPEKLDKPKIH